MSSIWMMAPGHTGGGAGPGRLGRDPPSWNPDRESSYSFEHWSQDILSWCILHNEMDTARQTAAIILQLQGPARDLVRNLTYEQQTRGGVVGGQQVDPVTFLLCHLAQNLAPLGEESRL